MEETISLKEIFDILRKHLTSILISMFVGLALAAIVTFFVLTPQYRSQAQLIVTLPQTETTNANDVNMNLQMINTYKELVTGDLVINQVKDRIESEYGIDKSVQELKDSVEVTQSQNSLMFSIRATDTSSVYAANIANTTALVFQENAKDVLSVDKISIISNAEASSSPVSPNNKLNLAIGLVLGIIVGVGIAFLLELLDRTVKDNKYVTETLGFTILGTVPQMSAKEVNATIQKKPSIQMIKKNTGDKAAESRRSRTRV
ncbi:Wzz/FepE/Etk N-terminal domain-containing protein [Enterococcus casseliflavus]|uniref:Capsular polysaccharide biosynthesis protein CpsC n=1 Tax=Enterococcus casseliflavus TaxID=37734 RepID=A0A6N3FQM2_ENTCA|nr:Wzz/FepE/Etk N-terminal domain-containing protein [Enterococcus casseliflavus]MEB6146006.1 Wzz/FepE/Etk N-terminal domain-containing protein [Enterococcus casseliflavus]